MSIPTSIQLNPINARKAMQTLSRTTGRPHDVERGSRSTLQDKAVIQVIDAPFDGTLPLQEREVFNLDDKDILNKMKNLPQHEPRYARILDITVHSDFKEEGLRSPQGPRSTQKAREDLISFLKDEYTQPAQPAQPKHPIDPRHIYRWLSDPLLVNDIGSISAQWSQSLGGAPKNLYRLVNRTSLQQHPLDYDVHPRDSYLTCAQCANDRLIVIIVNDVWAKQKFITTGSGDEPIHFDNPRTISTLRDRNGLASKFSDGTLDTFAKLLVLDFFLASIYLQRVDYYEPLIFPLLSEDGVVKFSLTKNPHLQVPLGLFEPRLSTTGKEAFKEIEDAEGILRSVNNLVDSIEFVLDALKESNVRGFQAPGNYDTRIKQLEKLCKERHDNADRALNALVRQLDYLTKRHAIREAKAIRVLTILAAFYLPLSLAATCLGMQTPFRKVAHSFTNDDPETKDHPALIGSNLLFDFFGVFIGLASVTVWVYFVIRFVVTLKANGLMFLFFWSKKPQNAFHFFHYGRRWRYGGTGGRIFGVIRKSTEVWLGFGMSIVLPIIFWLGMMGSTQKAWDRAKWMFTTYAVVGGLLGVLYTSIYWFLYHRRIRPQQKM